MSVWKFGNWLRDRSLIIGDISYIIGKGISIAIKPYFLKTKKVDTRRQNTNFFYCSFIKQTQRYLADFGPRYHNKKGNL